MMISKAKISTDGFEKFKIVSRICLKKHSFFSKNFLTFY